MFEENGKENFFTHNLLTSAPKGSSYGLILKRWPSTLNEDVLSLEGIWEKKYFFSSSNLPIIYVVHISDALRFNDLYL